MATLYGANYDGQYNDRPEEKIPKGEQASKVLVAYDEYDLNGAIVAASDVIKVFKLPKGAKIVDAYINSPSMGATGIFDLGWESNGVDAADQNGLVDQADAGGQAVTKSMKDTAGGTAGLWKELGAETQCVITCTELTVATTGVVKCWVEYVLA